MIRLVASDLDGTLVNNYQQEIPAETMNALIKLHEKGILFVPASGRQYQNMKRLFSPLGYEIPFISENGSMCIYKDEVLFTGSIPWDIIDPIIDGLKEYRKIYHTGHCIFSVKDGYVTDSTDEKFLATMHERKYNIWHVEDFHEINEPVLKIAICDFGGTKYLDPFFKERVGDKIRVATAAAHWLDFIAPNANKGLALAHLMEHFGIKKEECICFGDQSNDLEMLHCAGTSYAMATAIPEVQTQADHVVPSVLSVLEEII